MPSTQNHIGYTPYSFGSAGKISGTGQTAIGVYPLYTNTTQITNVGSYLITLSGVLTNVGSNTAGIVTTLQCGYTYGSSSTASANTATVLYGNSAPYTYANAGNRDNTFSYSYPISITVPGNYLAGFASYSIGTALSPGSSQIIIANFSITRLG